MPDAQLAAYGVGIIALIGGIATVARGFRAAPASWAHYPGVAFSSPPLVFG